MADALGTFLAKQPKRPDPKDVSFVLTMKHGDKEVEIKLHWSAFDSVMQDIYIYPALGMLA